MKKNKQKVLLVSLTLLPFLSSPVMGESLKQVVQETLSTNPRILASESEKLAREQQLKQANGGYYPSIDITAGTGKEYSKNPATISATSSNDFYDLDRKETAITLRQNLFNGFETSRQVDQQQARVKAAEHKLASDRDEITLRTSQVYLNVIRKREILTLAQKNLNKHQGIFNKVQQRSKSGVGRSLIWIRHVVDVHWRVPTWRQQKRICLMPKLITYVSLVNLYQGKCKSPSQLSMHYRLA